MYKTNVAVVNIVFCNTEIMWRSRIALNLEKRERKKEEIRKYKKQRATDYRDDDNSTYDNF